MKGFGLFILVIGIICAIASFAMDVTVATGYGGRVNNIGLMTDKQNYILISCFIVLCGLLVTIFGKKSSVTKKCPFCAESINTDAIKCKHCGSDIKVAKASPSSVNYSFSLLNYNIDELIGVKNGREVINDYGVKKLAFEIKKHNPRITPAMLKLKYSDDIHEVAGKLPTRIQSEFIEKISNLIGNQ